MAFAEGWANEYVGIPWRWRGVGRDGVDCYGLLRLVYSEQLGVNLPVEQYLTASDAEGRIQARVAQWREVPHGMGHRPGDVAIMDAVALDERGRMGRGPHHLGIHVAPGQVMSARQPVGVTLHKPTCVVRWVRVGKG